MNRSIKQQDEDNHEKNMLFLIEKLAEIHGEVFGSQPAYTNVPNQFALIFDTAACLITVVDDFANVPGLPESGVFSFAIIGGNASVFGRRVRGTYYVSSNAIRDCNTTALSEGLIDGPDDWIVKRTLFLMCVNAIRCEVQFFLKPKLRKISELEEIHPDAFTRFHNLGKESNIEEDAYVTQFIVDQQVLSRCPPSFSLIDMREVAGIIRG